jgi:hypothetical protein
MITKKIREINDLIGEVHNSIILRSFKSLIKDYGELEVVKSCYEMKRDYVVPLYYFALLDIKYTEKYLRLCMRNNPNDGDNIFYANIGLMALNIDEGFKVIEEFARETHPLWDKYTTFHDVFEAILPIENERSQKMLDDMENGEFMKIPDFWKNQLKLIRREYNESK